MTRKIERSPWGKVQSQTEWADGIISVDTASHGGFKLSRARNATVPKSFRRAGGWYEEDCEANIVLYFFHEVFADRIADCRNKAEKSLKTWLWREWEEYTGRPLEPGESRLKDEARWLEEHADNWVSFSAWGSWHSDVPDGMVGLCARRKTTGEERYFLVPKDSYQNMRMVIDPALYQEIPPLV